MSMTRDASQAFRKLANLPIFKSHFGWGPLNSALLLAGVTSTAVVLRLRGELPHEMAVAAGLAALALFAGLYLGRRWDNLLSSLLVIAIALRVFLPERDLLPLLAGFALSGIVACLVQVISQWDKAALLRLGKFRGLRGPGLFLMLPFSDRVEAFIDQRVRVTDFRAERILTLDTVPVYIDAICFWLVWNAEKAVLEVEHFEEAVILSAQIALKDAVGRHELADLLGNRQKLGAEIQEVVDEKTNPWGITIQAIEISDVVIPEALEEAMSKRAQAERERQARIILATTEAEIAEHFTAAAEEYRADPAALHLRAMNMVYEGIRQRGSMVIVPSSAVETMGLGSLTGLAALGTSKQALAQASASAAPRAEGERNPHGLARRESPPTAGAKEEAR